MDIRQRDTRCFRIGAKYQARVAGERGPKGLDFAKTRGWKAARRADCSRREENNANNGRDVALWWARAYAANTITLWTRLPFKWKQTWNAKIHRRARATHETAQAPPSIIGMQIVHEHCIRNVPHLPKNISRTAFLMNARRMHGLFLINNHAQLIPLTYKIIFLSSKNPSRDNNLCQLSMYIFTFANVNFNCL